jgi:serine/threonine protein phosphatase PrpC
MANSEKIPFAQLIIQLLPSGEFVIESVTNLQPNSNQPKISEKNKLQLRYAISEAQGPRESMEDAHYTSVEDGLFCIFDGHGGRKAADFAARRFPDILKNHPKFKSDPEKALHESILATEDEFLELARKDELNDGTTLVVGLISGPNLYVANVGDSEAFVCRGESALSLTTIHNPSKNSNEVSRVQSVGGRLYNNRLGHPHLNVRFFNIAISRAIGDLLYKSPQYTQHKPSGLTADPDVSVNKLADEDKFLLLACDGVWDVLTHQEVADFINEKLKETDDLQIICNNLVEEALARRSMDNITVCLVLFSR